MNERIKLLAEQAFVITTDGKIDHVNTYMVEKFAKLIIGECAGIYDAIDNGNLHMGTDDYLEALHKTFRSKK